MVEEVWQIVLFVEDWYVMSSSASAYAAHSSTVNKEQFGTSRLLMENS